MEPENYREITRQLFKTPPKDPYTVQLDLETGITCHGNYEKNEIVAKFLIEFTVEGMKELFGYREEDDWGNFSKEEKVDIHLLTSRHINLLRKYVNSIGFELLFDRSDKRINDKYSSNPLDLSYHVLTINANNEYFYIAFEGLVTNAGNRHS